MMMEALFSFSTKCNDGINPRGAPRRQPAGDHYRDAEHDRRANARNQIRRGHFGPLISDHAHHSVSRKRPDSEAERKQHRALLRHKLNDLARGCAKCAADAELAFASRNLKREQAIQTHSSEDKPNQSK